MIDNPELIRKGYQLLTLIYENSNKNLSKAIAEVLIMFNCEITFLLLNHIIVTPEQ
jgi:hypothetical protein